MIEVHQHSTIKNLYLERFTELVDERESYFLKDFYSKVKEEHESFRIITSIALTSIPVNTKILYEFMDCRNMFKDQIESITFFDLGIFQRSMVSFFFKVIKTPFNYHVYKSKSECEEGLNISFDDFVFSDRMIHKIFS